MHECEDNESHALLLRPGIPRCINKSRHRQGFAAVYPYLSCARNAPAVTEVCTLGSVVPGLDACRFSFWCEQSSFMACPMSLLVCARSAFCMHQARTWWKGRGLCFVCTRPIPGGKEGVCVLRARPMPGGQRGVCDLRVQCLYLVLTEGHAFCVHKAHTWEQGMRAQGPYPVAREEYAFRVHKARTW